MPQNYTCRYDPTHRGFANGVALGNHYKAEHGDVYVEPQRLPCVECGKLISENGITEHLKKKHPLGKSSDSKALVPVKEAKAKAKPAPEPWHPDQIVVPVVAELVGKAVPIEHLPTLFRWHAATAQMLEEIQ